MYFPAMWRPIRSKFRILRKRIISLRSRILWKVIEAHRRLWKYIEGRRRLRRLRSRIRRLRKCFFFLLCPSFRRLRRRRISLRRT